MLGWFVGFILFMGSSFPVIYWIIWKVPDPQKLATLFPWIGDFCHPILYFCLLIVEREKKLRMFNSFKFSSSVLFKI